MDSAVDRRDDLEEALEEYVAAQRHFDAMVGTSMEMTAYQRLRRARRRVAITDAAARTADDPTPVTA
jgi:hypothetical protein